MFAKKNTAPTLDDKRAAAKNKTGAVLSRFQGFVSDLESGADEHESVRDTASAEAARLNTIASESAADAAQSRALAGNIRGLLS